MLENTKIINIIVRDRLNSKECMDCGKELVNTVGYCKNDICGNMNSKTIYTKEEFNWAENKYEKRKRRI